MEPSTTANRVNNCLFLAVWTRINSPNYWYLSRWFRHPLWLSDIISRQRAWYHSSAPRHYFFYQRWSIRQWTIINKLQINLNQGNLSALSFNNKYWKYRLQNGTHFNTASMSWIHNMESTRKTNIFCEILVLSLLDRYIIDINLRVFALWA